MASLSDALGQLFSTDGFVPRRVCGLWPDWLVWEHVAGNALVWLAYLAVPALIWRLAQKKPDWTRFAGVFRAFAAFIGLCGVGHFLDMLAFFHPMYRLSGGVLIATGVVSWWTVWSLRQAWPALMELKSPAELERVIAERTRELTRAVDDLRRAEEDRARLATLVESSHDAIVGNGLDGVVTSWNAGAEKLFGYPAAEVLGRPITFLVPEDRRDEESVILARLRVGERVDHFDSVRLARDGRSVDVSLTISPIKDASGKLVGISKIARDIGPRRRADTALRESEGRFRALTEMLPQLVWITRPDGAGEYASPQWFTYTGYADSETLAAQYWDEIIHPEDRLRVEAAWGEALAEGTTYDTEYRMRRHDGAYRWFRVRGVSIREANGGVAHWFGTCTDIHDERLQADALRESEDRQRRALSAARLAHWEWDVDTNRVDCPGLEALCGRPEDEPFANRRGFFEAVHPDDRAGLSETLARCVRDGNLYESEFRVVWPDGSVRWLAGKGDVFRDETGRVVRMAGVNIDITEKKRDEAQIRLLNEGLEQMVRERTAALAEAIEALRESERRFRAIFDSTFQFIGLLTPEGAMLEANQTALDFAGVPREDVVGRPIWQTAWLAHSEEARDRMRRAVADASDGRFVRYEEFLRGRDGTAVTVDFSLKPVCDESGRVVLLIPEGRPITEQKQAAEALRLSEERFRGAFEASTIGMALVAPDGHWLRVNRSLCEIVGYTEEELLGMRFQDISHPDGIDAELGLIHHLSDGEIPSFRIEKRFLHKDGHVIWAIRSVSLVRDDAGRPLHFVAQIEDVTDRKRFEEDLLLARDEAMAATRAKGDFLANMSHEIRTPMNGVIGMTELLLDTKLNDLQRDYAETIRGSGEALLTVINDILDFSKIEAGKFTLESADFDLRTLMEEVADLLAPRVHQKGLAINVWVDPKVPGLLKGDPGRVRQVLTNLAGNAVKFTDRGEVNLEATLVSEGEGEGEDEDGEWATVKISVHDTGAGIPHDRQADVFESFTQIEGGSSRKHGGTGLGLTICRNLVDLMGGKIGLESVPGEGSTFWFELTLGKGTGGSDAQVPDIGGLRVLVVDDHEPNRTIAREALLSWKCRPEVVGSGVEALARLLATPDDDPYALVLLDHLMPEMDGIQTARVIKGAPRFASVPIVLLTSLGAPETGEDFDEAMFVARLTKPLRRSQLFTTVCRAVAASSPDRVRSTVARSTEGHPPLDLRILLAEDNDVNRRVATGLAERLGCRVDAVENGREALEALDYDRHDLVLMDVQMPEMDGLTATSAIRRREVESGQHIPIIAMTAHAMQGDREKCLAAGMDGYLTKPLRPGPLREALIAWAVEGRPPAREADVSSSPGGRSWLADSLRESCGEDPKLVSEVVGMLLEGTPRRLERLEAAIAQKDSRQVSWEAHALKGVFLTVGAEALASACQDLITRGELGDFAPIESIYPAVRNQWDRLEEEATSYLETLTGGHAGNP